MKMLLQEWLLKGEMSPYCPNCAHFLAQSEPRIVQQPFAFPCDFCNVDKVRFVDSHKSTPLCNECFYHDDGTPSNFEKRGES